MVQKWPGMGYHVPAEHQLTVPKVLVKKRPNLVCTNVQPPCAGMKGPVRECMRSNGPSYDFYDKSHCFV